MMDIDGYVAQFTDEPGYLDFARVGPVGRGVKDEEYALSGLLGRARFGSLDLLEAQDARVREAVASLIGFDSSHVVFQPNTSQGLMHAMFGITGGVALSPAEFPSVTFAAVRAAESLGVLAPQWLTTDDGRVTPGNLRDQLDSSTVAVAVSLVDFRTGYLADIEGIRQVIGDRLLIVDAIQGFGVVEAPWHVADVIVSGGQKWVRSGWGTGFLAMSDRALEQLTPVFSGFSATDAEGTPLDEVLPPTRGVGAFSVSNADRVAQGRFAAALEEIAQVGVGVIRSRIIEATNRIIDIADEFGVTVVSSRPESERAGIVVIEPAPEHLAILGAALYNHGVTTTTREGRVRLSAHVSTNEETHEMLRAALMSFGSAINV
ncbi:aminotransferase class V-fold PLP-dependent enzyme [Glaciihabitans arcticus]|uniref:Aminotransferase class V-fold PLP-dependent enzyme n=1 Tax=Glaciihabitans arcticus TaxID=2668039 RepID=A0A4Q9GR46_9MICO|nr:aminotransferase class V-fold PLP-dependent enzyme [Glaciihabitans arcticus]TBN57396.1 aminotransferase class V-fold PLP-dependent enzyme [Glaciihabitans arcticus]